MCYSDEILRAVNPKTGSSEWQNATCQAVIKISGYHFQTEKSILMNVRFAFQEGNKLLRPLQMVLFCGSYCILFDANAPEAVLGILSETERLETH